MNSNVVKNLIFAGILILIITMLWSSVNQGQQEKINAGELSDILKQHRLREVNIQGDKVTGKYVPKESAKPGEQPEPVAFYTTITVDSTRDRLSKEISEYNQNNPGSRVKYTEQGTSELWPLLLQIVFPFAIVGLVIFFIYRQVQSGGAKAMSFGKSRARLQSEDRPKVVFGDVAGCDEAKEELVEVVDFLKDPQKFQRLGGKIPKGVLLFGQPGTGKTLLARAVAGEASVPFFSISGSEFVEMFVGVGASRVRDLFEQGKKSAPCIIFMDEIDAVGRHRFTGLGGGHDEREQTLNQILVEMDGFDSNDEVILIAATNRPDVLDPALLRPGRFDRRISVDMPDCKGREEILGVHAKKVVASDNVRLDVIARRTPGFSGADLANVLNEAALLAARRDKDKVEMVELEDACDRVMAGPEKRSRVMTDKDRKIIAYHESGHALLQMLIPEVSPLHKVSILPRGMALGYTMHLPTEDRYLTSRSELVAEMAVLLGGRVAEEMVFSEGTNGASNDLERVTKAAHLIISRFGMNERMGPIVYETDDAQVFLGRDMASKRQYSEETAHEIDQEVRKVVDSCHRHAKELLEKHKDDLDTLAGQLLEKEVMNADEVYEILPHLPRKSGWDSGSAQDAADPVPSANAAPEPAGDGSEGGEVA